MITPLVLAALYGLFLPWHEPWLVRRLRPGEAATVVGGTLTSCPAAGPGFSEEVAVVRSRSRRDLLSMIVSPAFLHAVPHTWASLEQTVAVPCRRLLLVDPAALLPLVLLAAWLLTRLG
jgi:hypothetical protein